MQPEALGAPSPLVLVTTRARSRVVIGLYCLARGPSGPAAAPAGPCRDLCSWRGAGDAAGGLAGPDRRSPGPPSASVAHPWAAV